MLRQGPKGRRRVGASTEQHVAETSVLLEEPEASEADLRSWVEHVTGAPVTGWDQISGGNRCRSWAVETGVGEAAKKVYLRYQPPRPPSAEPYTVWREARIYQALKSTTVPAPQLFAVHPDHPAILTELKPGRADYRSLRSDAERSAIADDFVKAIAGLHRTPFGAADIPGLTPGARIADCVRGELDIWTAMYAETRQGDPLIELALSWLRDNLPDPDGAPVLVHGDAGPGNFLFQDGRMTALLDWELAHAGDPMEDLAWFSMRNVMEPVPDFTACIRAYEAAVGAPVDVARIRYHRVFVSARVVIIRHRNVTGEPGNSIVSRSLNRRLLVDALAQATQIDLPVYEPADGVPTPQTPLYDMVIDDLRDQIAGPTTDGRIRASAKNAAKVLKYLREVDRLGLVVDQRKRDALASLLGHAPKTPAEGEVALLIALRDRAIPFEKAVRFMAFRVAGEAQLAALTSGGLASRCFPSLESLEAQP